MHIFHTLSSFTKISYHKHSFLSFLLAVETKEGTHEGFGLRTTWVRYILERGSLRRGYNVCWFLLSRITWTLHHLWCCKSSFPISFPTLLHSCISRLFFTRCTLLTKYITLITLVTIYMYTPRHPFGKGSPFRFYTYYKYIFFDVLILRLTLN